jgi:hypothetical protein
MTYLQCGLSVTEYRRRMEKGKMRAGEAPIPLGLELPWLGMQVRRLGRREMGFEVGVVDARGREGVVRCTSFKVGQAFSSWAEATGRPASSSARRPPDPLLTVSRNRQRCTRIALLPLSTSP